MFKTLLFIAIYINAQGLAKFEEAKRIPIIWMTTFTDCEGKDAGNYTNTIAKSSDAMCSQNSVVTTGGGWVAHTEKGDIYMGTSKLAFSFYPAGGETVFIWVKL